jgi:glycosyltransferase involved in cell wall biosynthesis
VILSSSHAVAKGVLTHSNQLHISYVHTPIRYAFDLYHQYLKESGLDKGFKGTLAKYFLHKIRMWDMSTLNRVDYYIANSYYIARRIKKVYGKESTVIYPPVDVDKFAFCNEKGDYYFTVSRMVPYKKIDLIVETFAKLGKKLVVGGTGPDMDKIKRLANNNIEFLGFVDDKDLINYMKKAKAFVFAAEEDFGIVPVEAQACGTPVICLGKGGTKETVVHKKTGIHFIEQTFESLSHAIIEFEKISFNYNEIRLHSLKFSKKRFEKEIEEFVNKKYEIFKKERL